MSTENIYPESHKYNPIVTQKGMQPGKQLSRVANTNAASSPSQ